MDGRLDGCLEGSGNGEGVAVLDAEYAKNAPFREVVDVVIHEPTHDAIFKSIRAKGGGNELTAYWRHGSIKDFVEFRRERYISESSELENEPTPSKTPRKAKAVLIKLPALVIFILFTEVMSRATHRT